MRDLHRPNRRLSRWRDFDAVREFVRGLKLNTRAEWQSFANGRMPDKGPFPTDVPKRPEATYKYGGWAGWPDWLGTEAASHRRWRHFLYARRFAWFLHLQTQAEWVAYCRGKLAAKGICPEDIPSRPEVVYRDAGWVSWPDWLGTACREKDGIWRDPFPVAREVSRSLGLKTREEWLDYCSGRRPDLPPPAMGITSEPDVVYADCWVSWRAWLGVKLGAKHRRNYRDLATAKAFVTPLGLRNNREWRAWCRGSMAELPSKPDDIPTCPEVVYRKRGWISWGDFLGSGSIPAAKPGEFRAFDDARAFVRKLGLNSGDEWQLYSRGVLPGKGRRPADIPSNPHRTYRDCGWRGMPDWLGRDPLRVDKARSFRDARAFVRTLGLRSAMDWRLYSRHRLPGHEARPLDIPSSPDVHYRRKGWLDWGDWLGVERPHPGRPMRLFGAAREFIRGLGLRGNAEWRTYSKGEMPDKGKRTMDIPGQQERHYKGRGWLSWPDWLGTRPNAPAQVHRARRRQDSGGGEPDGSSKTGPDVLQPVVQGRRIRGRRGVQMVPRQHETGGNQAKAAETKRKRPRH